MEADFFASIKANKSRFSLSEGRRLVVPLVLKNRGRREWSSMDSPPVFLSYHLLDSDGRMLRFDNPRTRLPETVMPGQSVSMPLKIRAPLDSGRYRLELDFVREGAAWFSDGGSPTLRIDLVVKANNWPGIEDFSIEAAAPTMFQTQSEELNTLYKLIRLTLDENLVRFRGQAGEVSGFSAGTEYPQIWLRDAGTILPASRLFFERSRLSSWLEEHLRHQQEDGSLLDWLDSRGRTEKNTVETDQECSAVQAARQIFDILGPSWLSSDINGKPLLERLAMALNFVWQHRRSARTGLITGAHTADWGDVDMVDADQEATDIGDNTHWTADIYDQAMFHAAAADLVLLLESAGRSEEAAEWSSRRDTIRRNASSLLWMADRGYYRVHIHLDELAHDFDEDEMFAMGGNAAAILSGLADAGRAARIIRTALERQKQYQVSTISGTLLPPYPHGVFRHSLMDDPYEYQNGGQWDWFGGRLILAMYSEGFSRTATDKLKEIARKNIANGGFFEWEDRAGTGRGSDYYAGSAGVLARAVLEGYFGVSLTRDSLSVCCRLGTDEGRIRVSLPAADSWAAYEYGFDAEADLISLHINSSLSQSGNILILSPWTDLMGGVQTLGQSIEVSVDGQSVPHRITVKNEDTYIAIGTDFKNRQITVRKK
jgi:hypothetical protein